MSPTDRPLDALRRTEVESVVLGVIQHEARKTGDVGMLKLAHSIVVALVETGLVSGGDA